MAVIKELQRRRHLQWMDLIDSTSNDDIDNDIDNDDDNDENDDIDSTSVGNKTPKKVFLLGWAGMAESWAWLKSLKPIQSEKKGPRNSGNGIA